MTQQNNRPDPADEQSKTQGSGSDTVSAAQNPTSPVGQSPQAREDMSDAEHGGSDTASAAGMSSDDSSGK